MFRRALTRPDGRRLFLYAADEEPSDPGSPSPGAPAAHPATHLRWHPLRGEWVAYATSRHDGSSAPPAHDAPRSPDDGGDVPRGRWDMAVFEDGSPASSNDAQPPRLPVPTRAGKGSCEVVVFAQDPGLSLGQLPLPRLELLFEIWADRTRELGSRGNVQYVLPFESRGAETGAGLQRPHGRIHAYPFVPPLAARELAQQKEHLDRTGRVLLAALLEDELRDERRLLWVGRNALALVPVCARYAYEVWIAPLRPAQRLYDLDADERRDVSRALKLALLKLDGLRETPMPYLLAVHQAPTDGLDHPEAHLHLEILPCRCPPGRPRDLAAEIGAFTSDALPEEKAAELRAVAVPPV
jgi:UDPglucose--hexose-1-phosphate uridylyltransferase